MAHVDDPVLLWLVGIINLCCSTEEHNLNILFIYETAPLCYMYFTISISKYCTSFMLPFRGSLEIRHLFMCWSHILTMHYSSSHLHFPSWNLLNQKVLVCLVMVGETALQKCANFICRVSTYIMQSYMGLLLFSRFEAEVSVVAI